jgi:hypothetical protein
MYRLEEHFRRARRLSSGRHAPQGLLDLLVLGAHRFHRPDAGPRLLLQGGEQELVFEHRVASGTGTDENEKHRLIFIGVPCYPIFRRFHDMFSEWGGTFVGSTYLWFASGGLNEGFEHSLENPQPCTCEWKRKDGPRGEIAAWFASPSSS